MKDTVRLNCEFPRKLSKSEYEDELLAIKTNKRLEEMKEDDESVTWEEACRLAGWEDGHSSQKIK